MIVVAKVGTSSLTDETGEVVAAPLLKLCAEIATVRAAGHEIVLVSSGAIAAGLPALGLDRRPTDIGTLQAVAAIANARFPGLGPSRHFRRRSRRRRRGARR